MRFFTLFVSLAAGDLVADLNEFAGLINPGGECSQEFVSREADLFPKIVELMQQECFKADFLEYLKSIHAAASHVDFGISNSVVSDSDLVPAAELEVDANPNAQKPFSQALAVFGGTRSSTRSAAKETNDLAASENDYFKRTSNAKIISSHDAGIVEMLDDDSKAKGKKKMSDDLRVGLINGLHSTVLKRNYLDAMLKKK